ncbi:hypothetical protein F5Y11DRAFT_315595 [Daldinia sp. FL1419]|nr:hypothetical protein F5Y11DRAFT_315595 [Daldinia sp. FL1419]
MAMIFKPDCFLRQLLLLFPSFLLCFKLDLVLHAFFSVGPIFRHIWDCGLVNKHFVVILAVAILHEYDFGRASNMHWSI